MRAGAFVVQDQSVVPTCQPDEIFNRRHVNDVMARRTLGNCDGNDPFAVLGCYPCSALCRWGRVATSATMRSAPPPTLPRSPSQRTSDTRIR